MCRICTEIKSIVRYVGIQTESKPSHYLLNLVLCASFVVFGSGMVALVNWKPIGRTIFIANFKSDHGAC